MHRSHLLIASVCVFGMAIGCGDSGTDGEGGGGGGGDTPAVGVQPPERPETGTPGDGTGKIFGTSHIYIGTKTRAGADAPSAWADFGYDLDGQVTASNFSNHCKPAGGAAPTNTFPDGTNGIDNAFGKVLLPIIKAAADAQVSDLEGELNNAITEGSFNIMLNLTDLGDGTDYDPISALLLAGKDGNGNTWKAAPEFLTNPEDPTSSKVKFPTSYVVNNVWVSGDKGTVDLSIAIAGFDLSLKIESAVISMELDGAHGSATNGIIAGVLDAEALISQLRTVLGAVDKSFCDGAAVDGILNQIRQASDIMKDGSQNPAETCDGISIGLGFDATVVTLDGVGEPAAEGSDPCLCGNNVEDPGEGCDDGNLTDGDGCDKDCQEEI